MFLLDTNVISEFTKPAPNPLVLAWFAATPPQAIYICSVTVCEIALGLEPMPKGKRRSALTAATQALLENEFDGRCLSLDARCATAYGALVAQRERQGRPCSAEDGMIAAIALTNQYALVTRNTKDFAGINDLRLIDPWTG